MASKTAKQQLLVIASAVMFFGSTAAAVIHFIVSATAETAAPTAAQIADFQTLQQQAQGYAAIVKREPNNQAALEGLMRSRMALNDPKGAAEPLAQLLKLNPQRQDYLDLMRQLKAQQAGNYAGSNNPFSGSAAIDSK